MSTNNQKPLDTLKSPVNISKLPPNATISYLLDQKQDWVSEILIELNSKATALPEKMKLDQTKLEIKLDIKKKFKGEYGEFIICSGKVNAMFFTECIKTLATMKDSLEVDFKAMFLDSSYESMPEYQEQTEAYYDQEVYELYYFERRKIDLKQVINEFIFLNIDPYPSRE